MSNTTTATPLDVIVHANRRAAVEAAVSRLDYEGCHLVELPYGVTYWHLRVDTTREQILEDLLWHLRKLEYQRTGVKCQGHLRWEACKCFPGLSEATEERIRLTAESAVDEVERRLQEAVERLEAAERRAAHEEVRREARLRRMGL